MELLLGQPPLESDEDEDAGDDDDDDDDQLLDVTSRLNLQVVLVPSRMKRPPEVQPEAQDPQVY